jgi:hypothetical protein
VAGTLAFLWLAITLSHRPGAGKSPFADRIDDAQRIRLESNGARLELQRSSPTWVVTGESGRPYAVESGKLKRLLTQLKDLKVDDVISKRESAAPEFELDAAHGLRITLLGSRSDTLASGVLGKQSPDLGHLYFKYADKPEIYLARGTDRSDFGSATLNNWRDPVLLNIVEDQIFTVFIEGPGYKTALARSSDTWSVNGRKVNPTPVWGMLGVLAHLRAEDFVNLKERPDLTPEKLSWSTVTIQLKDGTTQRLHIGQADKTLKRHPVVVNDDPIPAWVGESPIRSILQKPSDFPTATRGG